MLDLCCGTGYGSRILAGRADAVRGVDIDGETIAIARRDVGGPLDAEVEFVEADALQHLDELDPSAFGAVVCFEGIEHVPDPVPLVTAMGRLARHGTRLIVSLPNSRAFGEENPYHLTDVGYEQANELFQRLGDPVVLSQYLTEGSLLVDGDDLGSELVGRLVAHERPSPEWANNWVAVVNVPHEELRRVTARVRLTASANNNEYMRTLERANSELERANRRLARGWLGVHDAAAATVLHRYGRRATQAEARVEELERRLAIEIEVAKENDRLFQQARRALASPRYQAVDRGRDLVMAIPGAGRLLRTLWRLVARGNHPE